MLLVYAALSARTPNVSCEIGFSWLHRWHSRPRSDCSPLPRIVQCGCIGILAFSGSTLPSTRVKACSASLGLSSPSWFRLNRGLHMSCPFGKPA